MSELNVCVLGDGFAKGAGDKEMSGWAGRLLKRTAKDHGPINFYNLGIPGQSSVEVSERLNEVAIRMPQGSDNRLILSFGVDDTELVKGRPRQSNQASLEALKSIILQTRPRYKMMMVGPVPVYEPQRNARIKRINALFHDLCLKARVPYIDLYSTLIDDINYRRDLARHGKIYPSDSGYEKIFDLIWNDRSWWFN